MISLTSDTQASPDALQAPTVFQTLLEPVSDIIAEQNRLLPKHHNQKLDYEQFITTLLYFFISELTSLKLFIATRLNQGLLPAALGLGPVPYSTFQEGFSRFSPRLFQAVFQHLVKTLPLKAVSEFALLGTLCCVDGSLFPVINSMLWAEYTSKHQALKLHLCFELNRMIPIDFHVGSGNSSERDALLRMAQAGVTYIADRGYMAFKLCFDLAQKQAFFIFRTKVNLVYDILEKLTVVLPESALNLFQSVSDERVRCVNDPYQQTHRLVRFVINQEIYCILTNRLDLTTFQVITLYAYRWQIELLFRFLKRTLNGIHLVRHDREGVTIQFYAMLIVALLQLHLKQHVLDHDTSPDNTASTPAQDAPDNPSAPMERRKTPPSRLGPADFLKSLGESVKKYWKIGIHWLTALRDLLARPFDHEAIRILRLVT